MQRLRDNLKNTYQDDKDSVKNLIKKVLEDEETSDVNEKNMFDIMTAANYLDMRNKDFDGYTVKLNKYKTGWSISYIPTKDKLRFDKRLSAFKTVGDDIWDLKASLANFWDTTEKRKKALLFSKAMIKDVLNSKAARGLYIHSELYQIGKTYLANAIINELADKGKTGLILFTSSFARQAKDFDNNEQRVKEVMAADILVIDDIGSEFRSSWFRDEILLPILNSRLSSGKLTIFTSNYSISELQDYYTETSKNKGELKNVERLVSRIYELADEVELDEQ